MTRGLFITFEGGEGAGKTTQARWLAEQLRTAGHAVSVTHEPGWTPLGRRLRQILLDPVVRVDLDAHTEALLFLADRSAHVRQYIAPRLADGHIVICDRYSLSTLVYQGAGRGLPVEQIAQLNHWATQGLAPDLTVVLDVDPETGLARARGRSDALDRIEAETVEFHERIRQGFLTVPSGAKALTIVDGTRDVGMVSAQILHAVEHLLFERLAADPTEPVDLGVAG